MAITSGTALTTLIAALAQAVVAVFAYLLAVHNQKNDKNKQKQEKIDKAEQKVDENGIVKAIGYGSVRINVKSTVDESIMDTILIQVLYFDEVYINMGGYEIVAIANKSQLSSLDPFNENYTGYDKTYYQQAIHVLKRHFLSFLQRD